MLYQTKRLTVLFLLVFSAIFTYSQDVVGAYFCSVPFYEPGKGTLLETYLTIDGNSVRYEIDEEGLKQSMLEVTMIFKNGDKVKEYRKYNLGSPRYGRYGSNYKSFIDVQKIYLPDGVYNLELEVRDKYAPDSVESYKCKTIVVIDILPSKMSFSGIQFLDSYRKTESKSIYVRSGYWCEPYFSNVFPSKENKILFYMEVYWAAKEFQPLEDFVVKAHIESVGTGKKIRDIDYFSKARARNSNVFSSSIDIRNLPSGDYFLVIEVRTAKDKLVSKKSRYFVRENNNVQEKAENYNVQIADKFVENIGVDSLVYFVESLRPISDLEETRFIDSISVKATAKRLRQFFYVFWTIRSNNCPEKVWDAYKANVLYVDKQFRVMNIPGFETKKGEVYLKFGPPNSIFKDKGINDTIAKEVWHYYSVADLKDIKFVFEPSTNEPEGYKLYSSNMPGIDINN